MSPEPEQTHDAAAAPPAGDGRVHIYDAASTQREQVLKGFDRQREALLKAVDDQREAALAPIRTVQTRQAGGTATAGVDGRVLGPRGGAAPLPGADRTMAEIVIAIRAIVAEEVRFQLAALLQNADARLRAEPPAE
jgi:hypothetical protein